MTTLATQLSDLVSIADLDAGEVIRLFESAAAIKAAPEAYRETLRGRSAILLFEKASLRTRVSFEVGITRMGGHAMYFDHAKERIGHRESIKDYARNLERWVDCIIARTYSHETIAELAAHASVPVINALSDLEHPCQALADFFTLTERFPTLEGVRLAFVGDGNNVCHSLILTAAKLGVDVTVVTPKGFEPQFSILKLAHADMERTGCRVTITNKLSAVRGHHAVYTDTWVSMGQRGDLKEGAFEGYQVDTKLMDLAGDGLETAPLFMHCLPAHRGREVTDQVMDSPSSIVYDQAENRMHLQNALLARLLAGRDQAR